MRVGRKVNWQGAGTNRRLVHTRGISLKKKTNARTEGTNDKNRVKTAMELLRTGRKWENPAGKRECEQSQWGRDRNPSSKMVLEKL